MSIITINGTARLVYVARITIQFSPVTRQRERIRRELEKRHEGKNRFFLFFRTIAELFFCSPGLFRFHLFIRCIGGSWRGIDYRPRWVSAVPGPDIASILQISCCNINAFGSTFLSLRASGWVRKFGHQRVTSAVKLDHQLELNKCQLQSSTHSSVQHKSSINRASSYKTPKLSPLQQYFIRNSSPASPWDNSVETNKL